MPFRCRSGVATVPFRFLLAPAFTSRNFVVVAGASPSPRFFTDTVRVRLPPRGTVSGAFFTEMAVTVRSGGPTTLRVPDAVRQLSSSLLSDEAFDGARGDRRRESARGNDPVVQRPHPR